MKKSITKKSVSVIIGSLLIGVSFGYSAVDFQSDRDNTTVNAAEPTNDSKQKIVEASLPPTYLSVDGYKKCLSTIKKESSESWCLPENQPTECTGASWEQLKLNDGNLPYCTKNAKYAGLYRFLKESNPSASWILLSYLGGLKESSSLNKIINYGLKKECGLKGSIQSGDFSLDTSSSFCANVGMKLMQARLQKEPSVNTPFLLEYKDSSFYINNHKVLNNVKSQD
jgi:hypothetical protein